MNILYMITSTGKDGGHFYSLEATALGMGLPSNKVFVISVGNAKSPKLSSFPNYYPFVSKMPLLGVVVKLWKFVRDNKIDIIHAFDAYSFFFARIMSIRGKVLLTKCGGPPPSIYYPIADNFIVYSSEDFFCFMNKRAYRDVNIHHIPNRIKKITQNNGIVLDLKRRIPSGAKVILRIARFSSFHRESMLKTINLVKKMTNDGLYVKLIIVGIVQEPKIFNELAEEVPHDALLLTQEKYTRNASKLIDVADIVVGTGRGAMEAATLGKLLLSPVKFSSIPVLVTELNRDKFLYYNFSTRTELDGFDERKEYDLIKKIVLSSTAYEYEQKKMIQFAYNNFDIERVIPKYFRIYNGLSKRRFRFLDLILNFFYTYRFFINNLRNRA